MSRIEPRHEVGARLLSPRCEDDGGNRLAVGDPELGIDVPPRLMYIRYSE